MYLTFRVSTVGSITLHRADMLKALSDNLPLAERLKVHFSKRVSSYEQDSNGVTLHFEDGSIAKADLLVGADGIKSAMRATMYEGLARKVVEDDSVKAKEIERHVEASWTGTFGYRALVDTEKLMNVYPDHRAAKNTLSVCPSSIFQQQLPYHSFSLQWSGKNKVSSVPRFI